MMKRIFALVLAFVMLAGMVPVQIFAEDGNVEPKPTETPAIVAEKTCTTCGQENCTSDHTAWCAVCKKDNCGVDHTVKETEAPTTAATEPVCATCGQAKCESDHAAWCATCKKDNCGVTHVFCETCKKNDCGVDHTVNPAAEETETPTTAATEPVCATCGQADCESDHAAWCAACKKDDCGIDHSAQQPRIPVTSTGPKKGALVDKLVKFNTTYVYVWDDVENPYSAVPVAASAFPATMRAVESQTTSTLLYKLESADDTPWPEEYADNVWVEEKYLEEVKEPCATCGKTDCTSDHLTWCDTCKTDDCVVDHGAALDLDVCETCGNDPCTCEEETIDTCETCGTAPCTCDEVTDVCLIGFVNQEAGSISFFDILNAEKAIPAANCPNNLILTQKIIKKSLITDAEGDTQLVETVWYKVDSADDAFWSGVVSQYAFVEAKAFSAVVKANGLYATLDGSNVTLYKNLSVATDFKTAVLTGEYVVADFLYEASLWSWFVKLTPNENWPAEAEGYVWVNAASLNSLSRTSSNSGGGEEEGCPTCGRTDCDNLHHYCSVCENYTCTAVHLYCLACGEVECKQTHTYCAYCNTYDSCDIDHAADSRPVTGAVIPDNPTLTPGAEVSIVDEYGDSVAEGLYLTKGMKTSVSAWPEDSDDTWSSDSAAYQWQIRVDGQWLNIQGQTRRGMLISPAMVHSAMQKGSVAIRCVVTDGGETFTSDAIPVEVLDLPDMAMFALPSGGSNGVMDIAETGEFDTSYVVVQYVYTDGRIAASADIGSIIPGDPYKNTYELPKVVGYTPQITIPAEYQQYVTRNGNQLIMDFPKDVLTEQYANFQVVYSPDYVRYTIIHYWQNVEDDKYTEHERETIDFYDDNLSDNDRAHRTGEIIENAHKSYPGFYYLLYETPTAAADGSTVIEVYYDRYYYLMNFDLGGGYGMEAIYARYGASIPKKMPIRPGYVLNNFTLDGNVTTIPPSMPAENRTYVANWTGEGTTYSVVFWYENADNSRYSQAGVRENIPAQSGTIVNGADHKNDSFEGRDDTHFTYFRADENVTVDGDGSTVVNVYFKRNVYTVTFVMGSWANKCSVPLHASHTDYTGSCYTLSCDQYHVHTDDCESTITCGQEAHTHTDDCLICTTPLHTAHTEECISCQIPVHTHSSHCCTIPVHSHTPSECCSIPVHSHSKACCVLQEHKHTYDWNIGGWYYGGCYPRTGGYSATCGITEHDHDSWNSGCTCGQAAHTHSNSYSSYYTECNKDKCGLAEHNHTSGCVYCSENLEEHTHSESNNCYTDVIHAAHTEAAGCYKDTAHSHTDDCFAYSCGTPEHTHTEACYKLTCDQLHYHRNGTCYLVITRKYDASLTDVWSNDPVKSVLAASYVFQSSITGDYYSYLEKVPGSDITLTKSSFDGSNKYTWYYYLEVLPGADYTGKTTKTYEGRTYFLDHSTSVTAGSLHLTYDEDYYPITGFDQLYKKGEGGWDYDSEDKTYEYEFDRNREAWIYYTRNSYNLSFSNQGVIVEGKGGDIYYQADISNQYFRPDYPSTLEPGAYEFEGWYTSPYFGDTKFVFDGATMPAENIRLYANWIPVTRTVRFFLDKAAMEANTIIPVQMEALYVEKEGSSPNSYTKFNTKTLPDNSYLTDIDTPGVSVGYEAHPYSGFDFSGWFYLNEEGKETAFDPKTMPVHRDLDLYGKWSSNVLCKYNVYFALDDNADGVADTDANGDIIYVADPISGSGIAGRTHTFVAKGGEELYDPEGAITYQEGYFPTVGSHSIVIDIKDEEGIGANEYTFLYRPKEAVPYTVKYVNKATGEALRPAKVVNNNRMVVVTETFVVIPGYAPDAYQKTLYVMADAPTGTNEIIFYYEVDTQHAYYVVNHYVETLNSDLSHAGWVQYLNPVQNKGDIGKLYEADARTFDGYTLSESYTNDYNTVQKRNGATGVKLPGEVNVVNDKNQVTGTLTQDGMELNLYYTRNLYPYEFRYVINGTTTQLADPVVGIAGYDTYVTGVAKEIKKDLDGDGIYEDYRLYDPTETTKDIHISKDGNPLTAGTQVEPGDAKVNVATFNYVRCTQTMKITKQVVDNSAELNPDPNQEFQFSLLIHAKDGYHMNRYQYTIGDRTGDLVPEMSAPNTLRFSLKAGDIIEIEGLPTAEYTLTELNLPIGYYDSYHPAQRNKLTVDSELNVTATNTFEPANLTISKTVNVVEEEGNVPEVEKFKFTITPAAEIDQYTYKIGNDIKTGEATDGVITIELEKGQQVTFYNLPTGQCTVTEEDYSASGYKSNYKTGTAADYTEGKTAQISLVRGTTQTVDFMNMFPVGDLAIEKTVKKEFYRTAWNGGTFTFTVERTTENRPLMANNQYKVELDGTELDAKVAVSDDKKLTVTITFTEADAAKLKEPGDTVMHTLVIKNLPAGTYSVQESSADGYVQKPEGLTVSNLDIPVEGGTKASFENTVKRKTGNLSLEKILEAATGFNPVELPVGTRFSFTMELLEDKPAENKSFEVVYTPNAYTQNDQYDSIVTPTSVTMVNGSFTVAVEAGQSVLVKNLPEGKYRITESTIPSYANDFAHKVDGAWVVQETTTTDDGQMYTDIDVKEAQTAEVQCTNTYPVNRAELIIQKLVDKAYDGDTLPDSEFTFTVTLAEEDIASYNYKVYNENGALAAEKTATVTNKAFEVKLKAGQYAVIPYMPVCGYTVSETESGHYTTSYQVYVYETAQQYESGEGTGNTTVSTTVKTDGPVNASGNVATLTRTFSAGKTDAVVFTNTYKRHLGKLKLTKEGVASYESDFSFIFTLNMVSSDFGESFTAVTVPVTGNGSITFGELPVGTYELTEDVYVTGWSWRYEPSATAKFNGEDLTRSSDMKWVIRVDGDEEITITNVRTQTKWLDGADINTNIFGAKNERGGSKS